QLRKKFVRSLCSRAQPRCGDVDSVGMSSGIALEVSRINTASRDMTTRSVVRNRGLRYDSTDWLPPKHDDRTTSLLPDGVKKFLTGLQPERKPVERPRKATA